MARRPVAAGRRGDRPAWTAPRALPGEKLVAAAGALSEADLAAAEVFTLDDREAATGHRGSPRRRQRSTTARAPADAAAAVAGAAVGAGAATRR